MESGLKLRAVWLSQGMCALDVGLYLVDHATLVFGDLHLGFESSLHGKGVLVPRFLFEEAKARIERILDAAPGRVEQVVLNGDLKHEFGRITDQEWREVLQLFDLFQSRGIKVFIVKGNHDVAVTQLAGKREVQVVDELRMGKVLIAHGDEIPSLDSCDTIIIGHEHPAITLRDGPRHERFKCFLRGTFKGRTLIVMPSFLSASQGTDVLEQDRLSPFLQGDISRFEAYVVGDTVYYFGTLGKLAFRNV